ncbi:MAG: BadF/BadG/BcrA/BcrD ATPase family protein [Clostridia bacterium]|nr:BadF/BadG/BcrA/BcrD ATPase family protein [Clostridia bacterium]
MSYGKIRYRNRQSVGKVITNLDNQTPEFSVNEHCAGGTGSFFEDQMSRLKLNIEDYSTICENAKSIPRLSGRCAVFAKTDIIHRQQEGVDTADILLGLCYAMIRNYKAVIVKNLPVKKDVAFSGGVTKNIGVIRAIKDIFKLDDNELIISEYANYSGAVGAAVKSEYEI